jgi:hypothetical protein
VNWPDLEAEVKKWTKDHRNNGIFVSTKMIVVELRRLVGSKSIIDFAGTS